MPLEELESVYNIRNEWVKRRNALRLEEAKQSDASQLHTIVTKIDEIDKKIISIDSEIATLQNKVNTIKTVVVIDEDNVLSKETFADNDIFKAIEVLTQESKNLNFKSTKEDVAKILDLKTKIYSELFNDSDDQLNFITSKKELMYSSVLFDKIYSSKILDQVTIGEIQKIRENEKSYEWYDRSLIVSSLSLSLINFQFDSKKANLLLDFITDFETNVWERALTGLTIAIIYQKNRSWLKDNNFTNRLKTLQNNDEIQEGLKLIDFILRNKLYEVNLFNPNIFKIELFQNPMNCFVPFYDDNEILVNALNDAENDFELDEFRDYLNEMPFMDSYKYALCLGLSSGGLTKSKLEGDKAKKIRNSLIISDDFSPFQNLISEYYCFFNYFPKKLKDDVFQKQLLLANTDLRKYVLNKVMQLLLEANGLYNEKKYPEAINKYKELLRIDKSNKEGNWQLGNCYLEKKEEQNALNIFLQLEKETGDKAEKSLLYAIARCYNQLRQFLNSNEYCDKIELKFKKPSFNLLILKAENYNELGNECNAFSYCQKAEEKISDEEDMLIISALYHSINKYDDALRIIKKGLETKPKEAKYWRKLGQIYCDIFEWNLSIKALETAKELDGKNAFTKMSLGRSYLLSKFNIEEAKKLFETVLKSKNDLKGVTYGNLGHFYLLEANNEKAFENYLKCIQDLKDEKDFNKKMNVDLKFLEKLGIIESEYNSIKNKVIEQYKLLKK